LDWGGIASAAPATVKPKRKRKPLLPKNYVPGAPVDPERWLPLRERSSYRKKKGSKTTRDREMSKGASQGATPTRPDPPAGPTAASPPPAPAASSKGGKGKGRK
jgi:signal recognition particle subunit SRP72